MVQLSVSTDWSSIIISSKTLTGWARAKYKTTRFAYEKKKKKKTSNYVSNEKHDIRHWAKVKHALYSPSIYNTKRWTYEFNQFTRSQARNDEQISDDDSEVFGPAIAHGLPQFLDFFRVLISKLENWKYWRILINTYDTNVILPEPLTLLAN